MRPGAMGSFQEPERAYGLGQVLAQMGRSKAIINIADGLIQGRPPPAGTMPADGCRSIGDFVSSSPK